MKRTLRTPLLPYISIAAGILGLGLGIWLFAGGTDASGLLRTEHPANAGIFILTAIVMLAQFLSTQYLSTPTGYSKLFPAFLPATIGYFVAAAGILSTDIYELVTQKDPSVILASLAGFLAAGALVFLGLCRKRGARPNPLFHSCVTIYLMLHLISQYRNWSAEPQLQVYGFQLLASVFLMLSMYHRATLDAGVGKPKTYMFFNCGALYFCCVALCGGSRIFYGSMAIYCVTAYCTCRQESQEPTMYLPREVLYCLNALRESGYSAYAVGGCVRDALLGHTPEDYDICTSASPEQIATVFAKHDLVRNGEQHGTVGVIIDREVYEITTFRTEGGYTDARHPDWVEFVTKIDDDLARRDFTINAMAYSPETGFVDPWGGRADLKNKVLRAVGDPVIRFSEDSLRILRGVRFAMRFGFTPTDTTESAMISQAPLLDKLAVERVFSELCKLLPYATAHYLTRFAPIFTQVIPEMTAAVGFLQHSPHHAYDVFTHTAHVVEGVPAELPLRLAALLHDIGKPAVFSKDENGRGHFRGHAKESAELANQILLRLKSPTALRERVVFLVEHHMTPLEPDKKLLRRNLAKYGSEAVSQLLALQKADAAGKGVDEGESHYFEELETLLEEIRQEGSDLTAKDLAINGQDILNLGLEPGPQIGACMKFLLDMVHDEIVINSKEDLLQAAKSFFSMENKE